MAVARARLLARMDGMGLARMPDGPEDLGPARVDRALRALERHGVARAALLVLSKDAEADTRTLAEVYDALEGAPVPATEWPRLLQIWDPHELARLLGASASSVRRYAAGDRETPDDVAERLHCIALVVGDLVGSYNEIGIRNWFRRPRAGLSGKAPADVLGRRWRPHEEMPHRVRALARSLTGSPAT